MKWAGWMMAAGGLALVSGPVMAASLSSKERARVARAAPRDRDDVRYCLLQAKKGRSEEHTSELQSLMRISYAVFCLKKKKITQICLQHDIHETNTSPTPAQLI